MPWKGAAELEAAEKERERPAAAGQEDEETARYNQIEVMHTKVTDQVRPAAAAVGGAQPDAPSGMRAIDDIPTRTELIQYERRFSELYQQVAPKPENKKYFEMYNTLDERKRMLEKEVTLVKASRRTSTRRCAPRRARSSSRRSSKDHQRRGGLAGGEEGRAEAEGGAAGGEPYAPGPCRRAALLLQGRQGIPGGVHRNELYAIVAELQRAQGVTPE